jgi:hypothetical protein
MLSPESRAIAMDLLRPPAGYRIDQVVLTTYSLDLDVLLALPLAVLAQSDRGIDELLEDPLLLLEALREAGDRVHVFVDEGGIAIPNTSRALYALLERSVHPVRASNGGAFHPKVWLVRFMGESGNVLLRVAVASRNLTFDRSWDVALTSEASPERQGIIPESRPLAHLLRVLTKLALQSVADDLEATLADLAKQLERTSFPAPEGFDSPIAFQALGLEAGRKAAWRPGATGERILAIAPFVNRTGLDALASAASRERLLISRREALDELSPDALAGWDRVLVLSDTAVAESEDALASRPSGLHAKLIAIEHGKRVDWTLGSANFTAAALTGSNVEVIATLSARRGKNGPEGARDIDAFRAAGFLNLCEDYHRSEGPEENPALKNARGRLELACRALLDSNLAIVIQPDEASWHWRLDGSLELPPGVQVCAWPVSVNEDQARALELPMRWSLPLARLTSFVAFELSVPEDVDNVRLALKLPTKGMPEGRIAQVLRALIDSPERFMQFLRALLGGLEGLADWATSGNGTWEGRWMTGLGGETLLEDLLRVASRDPQRLDPVRRLIEDLRTTPEGREIVPDNFHAIWMLVDEVITHRAAAPAETRR